MLVQETRYTHFYSAQCTLISSAALIINVFVMLYSFCRSDGLVIDQTADGTLVSLMCHPCVTLVSP